MVLFALILLSRLRNPLFFKIALLRPINVKKGWRQF